MVDPEECEPEEFSQAVGDAIIQWQKVERECAHLFSHLLVSHSFGAWAVFYHIRNHSTRIEMLNIAARFLFHFASEKRKLTEWKKLSERLSEASALRNRLAHFEIDEEMTATGWKFTLGPPAMDWSQLDPEKPNKWEQRQKRRILAYSQIKDAWRDFDRLATDLNKFALKISDWNRKRREQQKSDVKAPPNVQESDSGHLVLEGHRRSRPKKKRARKTKRPPPSRA